MISSFLLFLLPTAILFTGMIPTALAIYLWRKNNRLNQRRTSLTRKMLRAPGQTLRQQIEELDDKFNLYLTMLFVIPLVVYAGHVSQSYFQKVPEGTLRTIVSLVVGTVPTLFVVWKLCGVLTERKMKALGLEGELSTGEELNQLMLDGCRVFHDIPIQYGNIDHVVISNSGVYSVNTKMYGKLKDSEDELSVTVDYENNYMVFPDRKIRIPVDQLATESNCLSDHLTKTVGTYVEVEPMLALPGWFIKNRIGKRSVCVFSPRNPQRFFIHNRQVNSPEMVQRIAYQVEQLCRDVEPKFKQ